MPNPTEQVDAVKQEHLKAIAGEIKSLRGWLDYLERDITTQHKGVVHALLLTSINESCMKLVYNAGIYNGAALSKE